MSSFIAKTCFSTLQVPVHRMFNYNNYNNKFFKGAGWSTNYQSDLPLTFRYGYHLVMRNLKYFTLKFE